MLHPLFFLISILSTIFFVMNSTRAYSHCLEDQTTLLLQLENEFIFNSSHSTKLVTWSPTDDCCSWRGVECDGAGHVIGLQLDDEAISGELESSSTLFSLRHLKKLNLALNNFKNTRIPRGHNLTYLTHLNLSASGFSGQVPAEVSILKRLVSLDLSYNWDIRSLNERPSLTTLLRNLTRLRELYLDGIRLSSQWGFILSSYLPDLRILSLEYCFRGLYLRPFYSSVTFLFFTLIETIYQLQFQTSWRIFKFEHVESQRLLSTRLSSRVDFPDSVGGLSSLYLLNLSHNKLSVTLPRSLGKLSRLGSLDLSANQLGGTIPVEIGRLTFLSILNLSYNMFFGMIPTGPQIQTFSADSFRGNKGLCGLPVNISCRNGNESDASPLKLDNVESVGRMEIEWEYVVAALGFVVGLGSVIWVLLCCRNLRKIYFEKFDEVLEQNFEGQDRKRRCRRRVAKNEDRR